MTSARLAPAVYAFFLETGAGGWTNTDPLGRLADGRATTFEEVHRCKTFGLAGAAVVVGPTPAPQTSAIRLARELRFSTTLEMNTWQCHSSRTFDEIMDRLKAATGD